jgi:hypothetical protein
MIPWISAGTRGKVVVSGGRTPENGSSNTVIISGSRILAVMVGSGWNRKNSATRYDHCITASTFLSFSGVFPTDPVGILSPGHERLEML